MTEPMLVSVIVPCMNRAHYLKLTLDSILQQDYPHLECIVVDGGSTDGTLDILKSYGDRLKWISEPDKGHADAINKGWKMSRGEVITWLNADDTWIVPDAVRNVVDYFQAHPEADVVYGECGGIDHEGNLKGMSYIHQWDLEYAIEYCDHCIPQPSSFIRRRIIEKVGWLTTEIFVKDHELWTRIGAHGGEIHYIPQVLGNANADPGISFDGRRVAPAKVQIIQKFFTYPDIPETLRRKKRRCISNAYLRGMEYAYSGGPHWGIIFRYALRAAVTDPTNLMNAYRRLDRYLQLATPKDNRVRLVRLGISWPVIIFRRAKNQLRRLKPRPVVIPNLLGDRDIEWTWMAAHIPQGPGEALDFGAGNSNMPLLAAQRGFNVTAVDLGDVKWLYEYSRLRFIRGDILKLPLPKAHYDLVMNCSTVEHVGLAGRYGVEENISDGDLDAMRRLRDIMKPGGVMLLTIPMGQDAIFVPLSRVYGEERLPRLLEGFVVEEEMYWIKDSQNRWVESSKEGATSFQAAAGSWNALENVYAIGCFVIRKPVGGSDEDIQPGIN